MTLDERLKHIVVDTIRTWPTKLDSSELLKQLERFKTRIQAACFEERPDI